MIRSGWAAVLLLCAAVLVMWPTTTSRSRSRAVLKTRQRESRAGEAVVAARRGGRAGRLWPALTNVPRRLTTAVGAAAGLAGVAAAGPVAGIVAAVYASLAAHVILRRRAARMTERRRRSRLDGLSALAADLRAGLPMPFDSAGAAREPLQGNDRDRLDELVLSAGRLADRTGAPLADLLDRIEADARATDRGLAAAAAQAAGARATAGLLAVLPLGGIALGFGIGVNPVRVLLHTPVGAACAVAALLLQLGGLAWSDRLNATARQVP